MKCFVQANYNSTGESQTINVYNRDNQLYLHKRTRCKGRALRRIRVVEDLLEGFENGHAVREHPVREQERVQEVDGEEAQVRQPFQESFRSRVSDLRHLQGNASLLGRGADDSDVEAVRREVR